MNQSAYLQEFLNDKITARTARRFAKEQLEMWSTTPKEKRQKNIYNVAMATGSSCAILISVLFFILMYNNASDISRILALCAGCGGMAGLIILLIQNMQYKKVEKDMNQWVKNAQKDIDDCTKILQSVDRAEFNMIWSAPEKYARIYEKYRQELLNLNISRGILYDRVIKPKEK